MGSRGEFLNSKRTSSRYANKTQNLELLQLAAAAESGTSHPLASAIRNEAQRLVTRFSVKFKRWQMQVKLWFTWQLTVYLLE
jgi:cation transport ATPase